MYICKVCGKELNKAQIENYQGREYKSCPKCSKENGEEHVYYRYIEDFGTTELRVTRNNPMGVQSWCTSCRGKGTSSMEGISCGEING